MHFQLAVLYLQQLTVMEFSRKLLKNKRIQLQFLPHFFARRQSYFWRRRTTPNFAAHKCFGVISSLDCNSVTRVRSGTSSRPKLTILPLPVEPRETARKLSYSRFIRNPYLAQQYARKQYRNTYTTRPGIARAAAVARRKTLTGEDQNGSWLPC